MVFHRLFAYTQALRDFFLRQAVDLSQRKRPSALQGKPLHRGTIVEELSLDLNLILDTAVVQPSIDDLVIIREVFGTRPIRAGDKIERQIARCTSDISLRRINFLMPTGRQ